MMDIAIRITGLTNRATDRGELIEMARFLADRLRDPESGFHSSQNLNVIRLKGNHKTIDDFAARFPNISFKKRQIDEPAITLNGLVEFRLATTGGTQK